MWPGGEYEYNGVKCKFSQTYEPDAKFEDLVDTIMSWFMHKKTPANLAMLYIDQPDGISHIYGPDNEEVMSIIRTRVLFNVNHDIMIYVMYRL